MGIVACALILPMLLAAGVSQSIGPHFHYEASSGDAGARSEELSFGRQLSLSPDKVYDDALNSLLAVDGVAEAALSLMPIGHPMTERRLYLVPQPATASVINVEQG